ncbi:AbrB/MazE/SpoVT family DNA-binding domain-containing protein [Allokutzneria oryzae]|uniref:AbrB/MazE/SpoVT family DNA-binding domain-containing protein n=1 Tax=Allokutzneria oryzae TaxID=1378989 RepID=A0ABV6A0R8_9PSEU
MSRETRLNIREAFGLLVVHAVPSGVFAVTKQGHLRLPASVRHCCGLVPGDRVLLVADPDQNLLVVHPHVALDELLVARHVELLGGDRP